MHSSDCTDCTFCFGCVGLAERDYHILNQPYEQKAYFKEIELLKKALGIAS
jgi:hypothetical protein